MVDNDWVNSGSPDVFFFFFFFECGEYGFSIVGFGVILRNRCGVQGRKFSNYSRRVNDSRVSLQELELVCIMFWIDCIILSHWYSGVVVGKLRW